MARQFRRQPNPGVGDSFFKQLELDRYLNWNHKEVHDWFKAVKADAFQKALSVEGYQPELSYKENVKGNNHMGDVIQTEFQRCIQQHLEYSSCRTLGLLLVR